jgi:hypothetical protein
MASVSNSGFKSNDDGDKDPGRLWQFEPEIVGKRLQNVNHDDDHMYSNRRAWGKTKEAFNSQWGIAEMMIAIEHQTCIPRLALASALHHWLASSWEERKAMEDAHSKWNERRFYRREAAKEQREKRTKEK